MDETMINVRLSEFVKGVEAITMLDVIAQLITYGRAYCSDDIKAVLELKEGVADARTD